MIVFKKKSIGHWVIVETAQAIGQLLKERGKKKKKQIPRTCHFFIYCSSLSWSEEGCVRLCNGRWFLTNVIQTAEEDLVSFFSNFILSVSSWLCYVLLVTLSGLSANITVTGHVFTHLPISQLFLEYMDLYFWKRTSNRVDLLELKYFRN